MMGWRTGLPSNRFEGEVGITVCIESYLETIKMRHQLYVSQVVHFNMSIQKYPENILLQTSIKTDKFIFA